MSKLDFAALLCSRLCHDLVSPVGAINNGLEILADETDASMRDAVLDLIEKSTRQTSHKLQFFRLAFGAAGGFSAKLDVRECEKAMRAFLDGSRVNLEWDVTPESANKAQVKILLNLGLVVSEAMIRGGTVLMRMRNEESQTIISVRGEGARVIVQQEVKSALAGTLSEDDLEPRAAPAYLAQAIACEIGGKINQVEVSDTLAHIEAILPN